MWNGATYTENSVMSNIGFSRKLNGMGYTSHRENALGSYSSKKIPMWDNLKIKKDRIGQDRTGCDKGENSILS